MINISNIVCGQVKGTNLVIPLAVNADGELVVNLEASEINIGEVDATLNAETTKVIGTVNNKVANGDDVTLGAKADAAATVADETPFSAISLLKGLWNKLTTVAQEGTDGTGITPPTGAVGIRGWLSGIYSKVAGILEVKIDQATEHANEVVTKTGSVTAATLSTETTKVIGTVNDKIADGDNITLGAKADTPATVADATPFSVIALLKGIWSKLAGTLTVAQTGSNEVVLAKGTTNAVGLPILFIDTTKNFETSAFVNKTAKLTINNIDYYRTIIANTASGISINPIQLAVGASVTLGGAGSAVIRCKTLGVAGNANKIILAAGTGLGSLLGVTWDAGTTTLTITSPTDGGGSPTDIAAGNLEALFAGVPAVDALFSVDDDISAGALDLVASPGTSFTGGLDAIAVPSGAEYEIIDYGTSSVQLVAGTANVGKVSIVGNTLEEQLTEADDDPAGTLTFAQNISTIEISNTDTVNAGVFTVNGIAINVPVSTTVKFNVGGTPSNIVTLTGATTYIVNRYV